ncbi:hypothetical protein MRB53_010453 [Persea americana]|uniref:Uncharacterized protein n=1 Tax=Persea americana TaxID=3435 RepID=A0ACC2LT19_PERAE|nr:hypothetical protein MRB53_010453 [Persea americana]
MPTQVCSTWFAVSRSELLWQNLTRRIWDRNSCLRNTWHDEYIHLHVTASNFRFRRSEYTPLIFDSWSPSESNDSLSCRRVALSERHLACGFLDGSIRVFDLPTLHHVSILRPVHRDRLGPFSRAVSGIILHDHRVVFASLDGDVHVADVRGPTSRRAHLGNVVNDGTLVDFTGCSRWWIGLYAGVPGRAFQVWNGQTEELVFVGGSLTDPESVLGWQLLIELAESVGRVRVSTQQDDDDSDTAGVACTGQRMMVLDLHGGDIALGDEQEMDRGVFVDSVDVSSNGLFMVLDRHGLARVCRVRTLEEVCRFNVRLGGGRLHGSLNRGYALVCTGGVVRVWDIETGGYLYSLRERMGLHANDLVADDERVAGCSSETGIHLWTFSA